jgi:predicted acyl esterase
VCLEGYRPEGLTCVPEDVDPCADVDCSGHGACTTVDGQAACACFEGYEPEGLSCVEVQPDPCEGITCSGQGACTLVDGEPACACLTGYQQVNLECLPEVAMVPMRDGTGLWTRLFLPRDIPEEGVAALLWRTPYRMPGRLDFMEDIGPVFSARGYAYLVQDCRGRGLSGGEFYPMLNAFEDGRDTTDWIVEQPWSNGRVGTMGCSYPGFAAMAAAVDNPNVYVVIADDPPEDPTWFTVGGLFRSGAAIAYHQTLDYLVGLDVQVVNPNDRLDILGLDELVLSRVLPVWQDWVIHENPEDPFWDPLRMRGRYGDICAPVVLVWSNEAWNDPRHVWQGLDQNGCSGYKNHHRMVATAEGHCFHLATLLESKPTRTGRLILDTIDKWLGEQDIDMSDVPRVQYRATGDWDYSGADSWPPFDRQIELYLGEGTLQDALPAPDCPDNVLEIDPAGMGVCDEDYPEAWFYTEPLELPTYMAGDPYLSLTMTFSTPDANISAVLYEYDPAAMQYTEVSQGRLRALYRDGFEDPQPLTPGEQVHITLPLWGRGAHDFNRGNQIVLMITGSRCFQTENPHTAEPLAEQSQWLPSTYTLHHDEANPSRLVLPVFYTGF